MQKCHNCKADICGEASAYIAGSDDEPLLDFSTSKLELPLDDDVNVAQPPIFCYRCEMAQSMSSQTQIQSSHSSSHSPDARGAITHQEYTRCYLRHDDEGQELPDILDFSHCHTVPNVNTPSSRAKTRLSVTAVLCLVFMIGEWVGGYLANSLAIMTDAAHLFSDFGSLLVSLFSIWLSTQSPSKKMSYGYHRAEVLAALASVIVIWLVTGVLVYLAIERIIHGEYDIDANTMLIVSGIGVTINIIMGVILHGGCSLHGHSHEGHGYGHGHHLPISAENTAINHSNENINVRAAFIHVIGDFIQSIGVLVAAFIIKYRPEYAIADPICTFLFSWIVMLTTVGVFRDTVYILMESFPKTIPYHAIASSLTDLENVCAVHDLHVWSLNIGQVAVTAHLALDPSADSEKVLRAASALVSYRYGINRSTFQLEKYDPAIMDNCHFCLPPQD